MNKSEQINELATALARAQGQMEGAKKEATNPHYGSRYADLAAVVDAVRGPLSENGIAWIQVPVPLDDVHVCVETVLVHTSGQWLAGTITLPVSKADPQGHGSALTYARRYGLMALTGVPAEDDDGNAASKPAAPAKSRRAAVDRDDTAVTPGVVSVERAVQDVSRIFGEVEPVVDVDEDTARQTILGQIKGCADKLRLKAPERAELWTKYVGGSPDKADVAALADLLAHLRSRG